MHWRAVQRLFWGQVLVLMCLMHHQMQTQRHSMKVKLLLVAAHVPAVVWVPNAISHQPLQTQAHSPPRMPQSAATICVPLDVPLPQPPSQQQLLLTHPSRPLQRMHWRQR
jgi:hypothetical protein